MPEVLFDPSLIVSPHVFLLGILFANQAFEVDDLTSADQLSGLDIMQGDQELPLPLKASLRDVFVFRKAKKTADRYAMTKEGLPYSTAAQWIRTIGKLAGFATPTIAYSLRYNAANTFDKSGIFCPDPHPRKPLLTVHE